MSPRAACRLATLGFENVFDYVGGKVDWLAHGLPREGTNAAVPTAGDLVDRDPPTCLLTDSLASVRRALEPSSDGFCLVTAGDRVVLGRIRRSRLKDADDSGAAESIMEPGPSTIRPDTAARDLVKRLAKRDLRTAIVTTPDGVLLGIFDRAHVEESGLGLR